MSLVAFQELFASLIADPALCKKIIANPSLLETDYDLTEREIKRINSFFKQKGMGVNCMLYQINRYTPVFDLMPYTAKVLHKNCKVYARQFWDGYIKTNFQFRDEVLLFGAYMQNRLKNEPETVPYLQDIVNFEITYNRIRYSLYDNPADGIPFYSTQLNSYTRMVFMKYDLRYLIDQVITNAPGTVFDDIPVVNSWYLIRFNPTITMHAVDLETAEAILAGKLDISTLPASILDGGFVIKTKVPA
jgi:hypothetical protein